MSAPFSLERYIQYGPSNTRYPEATIKSFNTNNILDCNTACDNEPTCIGYVYNKAPGSSMGQCVLKSSLIGSRPVRSNGSTTYIKKSANFTPVRSPMNAQVGNFTPVRSPMNAPVGNFTPVH